MASWNVLSAAAVVLALRGLGELERTVFLAMLDEGATYAQIATNVGIDPREAQRLFAVALVAMADALDASPPHGEARRLLRRFAAAARLAQRHS